jgi:hypothetical protein
MNSRRRIAFPKLGTSRIWLSTQAIKAGICDQRYGAQMVSFALQNSEPRMSARGEKASKAAEAVRPGTSAALPKAD